MHNHFERILTNQAINYPTTSNTYKPMPRITQGIQRKEQTNRRTYRMVPNLIIPGVAIPKAANLRVADVEVAWSGL